MESIAMLVVDMQQGLFDQAPRFDATGVVEQHRYKPKARHRA
jgi:nicotinamidase-related amidase